VRLLADEDEGAPVEGEIASVVLCFDFGAHFELGLLQGGMYFCAGEPLAVKALH
jgi:hypothetical protein